jgi:hypothetical protein
MKIFGFGDSFITDNELDYSYTNILKNHFDADCQWHGREGSGSWNAFFHFLDHRETCDVLIFVWSAEHRTYHPHHTNICPAAIEQNLGKHPVWEAAKQYYSHLYDCRKAYYEHVAFYDWVDSYLKDNYPDTKVIHLWSFPAANSFTMHGELIEWENYNWDKPNMFPYIHRFKHGVEFRPALINLSYRDGWPGDLKYEKRCHHMTPPMHKVLAVRLIDAIENYENGRLVDIS